MIALFVLGAPGVGKTTMVREILRSYTPTVDIIPKPKFTIASGIHGTIAAAGHYTGETFDGGDTVGYNQAHETLVYWATHLARTVKYTIFDGDRFSTKSSLAFISDVATVRGVLLEAPEAELAARRAARGSNQNPAWMKGRTTKAERFAQTIKAVKLDGSKPPAALASLAMFTALGWME